jgi:hypothetical protein
MDTATQDRGSSDRVVPSIWLLGEMVRCERLVARKECPSPEVLAIVVDLAFVAPRMRGKQVTSNVLGLLETRGISQLKR